jgi:hypothetical protein
MPDNRGFHGFFNGKKHENLQVQQAPSDFIGIFKTRVLKRCAYWGCSKTPALGTGSFYRD